MLQTQTKCSILLKAIQSRDFSGFQALFDDLILSSNYNFINSLNPENGLSLLHLACRYNFTEVVELLLNNGAEVSVKDEEGRKAIHHAAKFQKIARRKISVLHKQNASEPKSTSSKSTCLGLLIDKGADVNSRDGHLATPLHYACAKGHVKAVQTCLQNRNVKVEALDDHLSSPCHEAAKNGHLETMQELLDFSNQHKLDLLVQKDKTGCTPLMYACKNGHSKIVEVILKASNSFSSEGSLLRMLDRDWQGNTALHDAVKGGFLEIVKLLLATWNNDSIVFQGKYDYSISEKRYVDLDRSDGYSALHLAASQGHNQILQTLIDEQATIDCVNHNNETPMFLAAAKNQKKCVELLVGSDCDIEIKNNFQFSPFLIACKRNHVTVVDVLIGHGADVTAVDSQSRNCFIISATNGNDETLQMLLNLKESSDLLNESDHVGDTALHEAARNGHLNTMKMLISHGIPLSVCNDYDQTPLHFAATNNHVEVVAYIVGKEHGRINDVDECSRTALCVASSMGHVHVVKILLDFGAHTDIGDARSWTALHVCATKGWTECAQLLLKTNSSLMDKKTTAEETPLHLACRYGAAGVVKLLLQHGCDVTASLGDGRNPLDVAIDESNEACVRVLLEDESWIQSMKNVTAGTKEGCISTPLRKMIKNMPDMVELVLTKCMTWNTVALNDKNFQIAFNYELIEDMYEVVQWSRTQNSTMTLHPVENGFQTDLKSHERFWMNPTKEPDSSYTSQQIYDENGKLKKEAQPYTQTSSELYRNHPLKLMADTKRENLLCHPTVTGLLYLKWRRYGKKFYVANFLCYALYLSFLTYYVLATPPRFAINETLTAEAASKQNRCVIIIPDEQPVWGYGCQDYTVARYIAVTLVLGFSGIQLLKEIVQLLYQRLKYFLDYTNYIEVALYALSIVVFVDADEFVVHTGLRTEWQWECLSFTILLGWVNLLLYIRRSPLGIYVLMIESVGKSFAKFGLIVLFFLVGFAFSFYVLLQNQFVFFDSLTSIVKTLVMMTGEFDYQTIFLTHFTSDSYQDKVEYKTTSFIIFVIFVLSMSLLISNLLVGIAVDDISLVQEQATLRRLALQVSSVLDLEYALPAFIRRRMVTREHRFQPNKENKYFFQNWFNEENINFVEAANKIKNIEVGLKKAESSKSAMESIEQSLEKISDNQRRIEERIEVLRIEVENLKMKEDYIKLQRPTIVPKLSLDLTDVEETDSVA